jgi:hypothetical protein
MTKSVLTGDFSPYWSQQIETKELIARPALGNTGWYFRISATHYYLWRIYATQKPESLFVPYLDVNFGVGCLFNFSCPTNLNQYSRTNSYEHCGAHQYTQAFSHTQADANAKSGSHTAHRYTQF